MTIPRVIQLKEPVDPTEKDYDGYARKKLIKQLQGLLYCAHFIQKFCYTNKHQIIFFLLENQAIVNLLSMRQHRYLSDRSYRSYSDKRDQFVEEQLGDVSEKSFLNAYEFR